MPSFSDVLTKTAESIERPPLAPKGTYVLVVTGAPKKRDSKQWEIVDFPMQGIRPTEDVDLDEFKAFGGNAKNVLCRKSFLFDTSDENAFARTQADMRDFLTLHLGLDPKLTIKELISMAPNKQCLGVIDWRPNEDNPEIVYIDLKKTAPVE